MVAQPREGASTRSVATGATPRAQWLDEARAGDARAFEQLVNWHQGMLLQLAYHQHGGRTEDAMDSCQEALLAAWRALDRFDGGLEAFRSWLARILVNTCRDAHRAAIRRPRAPLDMPPPASMRPDPGQSPEDYASQQDLRALLERCLVCLSDAHREVILLDHLGFDYGEMAEILEVERGTIKSRLSRARLRMRDLLGGRPSSDGEPFGQNRRSIQREDPPSEPPGSGETGQPEA